MKIKSLTCMGLSLLLTLAFSATAFAATTPSTVAAVTPSTTAVSKSIITPNFISNNQPTGPGTCWCTASLYENVRQYPSDQAPIIGQLQSRAKVYVIEVSNGWATIQNGLTGTYGYVSVLYLSTVPV